MAGPEPQVAAPVNFDMENYVNYSAAAVTNAEQRGQALLFFAATAWCQTCSALEEEIVERTAEIPTGLTILKVDYDNDKEMKRKYGVTVQHTLVLLDKNGAELKRWVGGDFNNMLREVGKI